MDSRVRLRPAPAVTLGVVSLTFGAAVAVWVLNVEEKFGLISLGYGALAAAIPVGLVLGVLGGFVAEYVAGLLGAGIALLAGLLVEVATHMVLALTTRPLLAGTALAVFGFHASVWGTLSASLH